jgi:hypothetical protein
MRGYGEVEEVEEVEEVGRWRIYKSLILSLIIP